MWNYKVLVRNSTFGSWTLLLYFLKKKEIGLSSSAWRDTDSGWQIWQGETWSDTIKYSRSKIRNSALSYPAATGNVLPSTHSSGNQGVRKKSNLFLSVTNTAKTKPKCCPLLLALWPPALAQHTKQAFINVFRSSELQLVLQSQLLRRLRQNPQQSELKATWGNFASSTVQWGLQLSGTALAYLTWGLRFKNKKVGSKIGSNFLHRGGLKIFRDCM